MDSRCQFEVPWGLELFAGTGICRVSHSSARSQLHKRSCTVLGVAQSVKSRCASSRTILPVAYKRRCTIREIAQAEFHNRNPRSCVTVVAQSGQVSQPDFIPEEDALKLGCHVNVTKRCRPERKGRDRDLRARNGTDWQNLILREILVFPVLQFCSLRLCHSQQRSNFVQQLAASDLAYCADFECVMTACVTVR